MIPNELGEIDFSNGHSGGPIKIRGYQRGNCGTLLKLTSLELISSPDFYKGNDSRSFIIRSRKRKLKIDFFRNSLNIA